MNASKPEDLMGIDRDARRISRWLPLLALASIALACDGPVATGTDEGTADVAQAADMAQGTDGADAAQGTGAADVAQGTDAADAAQGTETLGDGAAAEAGQDTAAGTGEVIGGETEADVEVPGDGSVATETRQDLAQADPVLDNVSHPGSDPAGVDAGIVDEGPEAEACVRDCAYRECGDDGCGGSCGTCGAGFECLPTGRCDLPPDCLEDCTGHCGHTSCEKDCGLCPLGQYCQRNDCHPCPAECNGHCETDGPGCVFVDYPDCDGRTCGPDGYGGTCPPGCSDGEVCDTLRGTCVIADVCPPLGSPPAWGPAGVVSALLTPSDVAVIQATCFDYTGDFLGDNGLKGLASQINGPLPTLVENVSRAILFELAGVTGFVDAPGFQLNGLLGASATTPPVLSGDFFVKEASYLAETCAPMIYLTGARIEAGKLTTPKSEFRLSLPVQEGLVIDVTVIQAQLKGDIRNGDVATGFELENGVLGGVVTKQQLSEAVDKLKEFCSTTTPKPDFCSYLAVVDSTMGLIFDLHQVRDGEGNLTFIPKSKENPGDAASICLAYSLSKAKIVGFEPAP